MARDLGDPGPDPTVWLRRDRRVRRDGVDETFALVNRSAREVDTEVVLPSPPSWRPSTRSWPATRRC